MSVKSPSIPTAADLTDACPTQTTTATPAFARLTSGLAHELRNPLNAAILQLGALVRLSVAKTLPTEAHARIQAANGELQRISELIDDYMSLTEPRIVQLEPTILAATIVRSVERVRAMIPPLIQPKLLQGIEIHIPDDLPLVLADAPRLTQIFVHLLKNSLEATNNVHPSKIEIAAKNGPRMVEVRVRDNGPGVPNEIRPLALAFHPFVTTKTAGTGLGLTLVQQLVKAHGGEVKLESTFGDTMVHFTLPIAEVPIP